MIEQTEAIVLGARRFSESSKIVTLFTRNLGKIGVVARGAMRPKNKFGAALQPLSYVDSVIYVKEGRELQNISSAESVRRFPKISRDLERLSSGLEIVELVNAAVHGEDRNEELFDAIISALDALNDPDTKPSLVAIWFMGRLADVLGYGVRTEGCGVCDEDAGVAEHGGVAYSIPAGAPLCAEHRNAAGYRMIPSNSFTILGLLSQLDASSAGLLNADQKSLTELHDVLVGFLRYHVDGLRRLKVSGVTATLLGPTSL